MQLPVKTRFLPAIAGNGVSAILKPTNSANVYVVTTCSRLTEGLQKH
jgi:hypothetical protein